MKVVCGKVEFNHNARSVLHSEEKKRKEEEERRGKKGRMRGMVVLEGRSSVVWGKRETILYSLQRMEISWKRKEIRKS